MATIIRDGWRLQLQPEKQISELCSVEGDHISVSDDTN